jgi:WD40-like Beta Propeller Repeat
MTRWVLAAAAVGMLAAVAVSVWPLNRETERPGDASGATGSSSASLPALPAAAVLSDATLVAPRTADGNTDLFLVDAGSGATLGRVTTAPEPDVAPLLSPDRRTIAYVQQAGDGAGVLRVVAADGTGDRRPATGRCSRARPRAANPSCAPPGTRST